MGLIVEILRDKVIVANGYFNNAEYKYSKGAQDNCGCAVCYGLCLIIKGEKEKGLELVRSNLEGFKKEKGKRFILKVRYFRLTADRMLQKTSCYFRRKHSFILLFFG